jgi:hypothetical protein
VIMSFSSYKNLSPSSNTWITESQLERQKRRANQHHKIPTLPHECHPSPKLPLLPQVHRWVW